MSSKSIAALSADASLLVSKFSVKKKGEIATYDEIAQWIGWDIRDNRAVLTTVRRILLRDYDIILGAVFGHGYKILDDKEIVTGKWRSERLKRRRSAVRQKKEAAAVNLAELSEVDRLRALGEITNAHMTIETSADKAILKLETSMNGATAPLALNHALDALKHNV